MFCSSFFVFAIVSLSLSKQAQFSAQHTKQNGLHTQRYYKGVAQLIPAIVTPPTYLCVPIGACTTSTNGNIDPRIASPGASVLCPAGQEPCYGAQTSTQCGVRSTNSANLADGPATFGAYPWQAYVLNQTSFTGSGLLLDQYNVLTAAHKVYLNVNSPGNIKVYMGVWDPTDLSGTQNSVAVSIVLHPNFQPDTLLNDIAIIRLATSIFFGIHQNIGTACLPGAGDSFVGLGNCYVSGWGQTAFGANDAPTSAQRQARVPIVDYNTCRASMSQGNLLGANVDRFLDPSGGEICAGGRAQRDACTQDGGSPLVCPSSSGIYTVAGLVTWGLKCGQVGVYGVYVNVPFYRSWIDQTIAGLNAG